MAETEGHVSIAFSHEATLFYENLSPELKEILNQHLREIARRPERIKVGEGLYVAFIGFDDNWAWRVDYVIDERMRRHLPAIAVRKFKLIRR